MPEEGLTLFNSLQMMGKVLKLFKWTDVTCTPILLITSGKSIFGGKNTTAFKDLDLQTKMGKLFRKEDLLERE